MHTRTYWVEEAGVGISPMPRGGKHLEASIAALRESGVDILVSAQTHKEARHFELAEEDRVAADAGIDFRRIPVIDHTPPPFSDEVFAILADLATEARQGKRILFHCLAGIGRSATLAAGLLVTLGYDPLDAMQALSQVRGLSVPETDEQMSWIMDYAARMS